MKKIVFFVFVFLFGVLLVHPELIGLCAVVDGYYRNCLWGGNLLDSLGAGLAIFSLISLFFSVLFFFIKKTRPSAWLRFAVFWIPISILLIILAPNNDSGLFGPSSKTLVVFATSFLFFIISLVVVAFSFFRKK